MNEYELVKNLLTRAQALRYKQNSELDDIRRKGKMALENLFPFKAYSIDIGNIVFEKFHYSSVPGSLYLDDWNDGQNKLINLLDTAIKDFEIQASRQKPQPAVVQTKLVIQEKIVPVKDESAILEIKQQFSEYRQMVRKWIYFFLMLALTTTCLWVFYFYANWNWFNNQSKKLGLTLMAI